MPGGYIPGGPDKVEKKMRDDANEIARRVVSGGVAAASNLLFPGAGLITGAITSALW